MTVKTACAIIIGFLLLNQASALDVEKVREAIGVLLHKTMKATSFIRIPRESRNESEQNGDHSPNYDKTHYSLGPIGACSRPAISNCSFSSSITIPEYYARLDHKLYSSQMTTLYNQFQSTTNSKCADGIMSMICPYAIVPQCQSDAQVKFVFPDFETLCTNGVSKCPNSDILETAMCKSGSQLADTIQSLMKNEKTLKGKSFALTKCRVPSISACSNVLPSPNWLAAEQEAYFNKPSLDSDIDTLSDGNEECKNKLYQFLCAFPTCNADETAVVGHRNPALCEDALACVPPSERSLIANCSGFASLDKPSPNYTRGPPKSLAWWECLCIAVGCALGVVLLVGTIVSVRKRTRRRRLEIYQKMETSTT